MVDEGMIVLRKRIHEMKMVERNYEPPANWMDWEKRYFAFYDADVCEVVGVLQSLLMNTRPALAIGMMGLVTLSVPTSMFMVMSHLIDVAKGILSGA
ncbi:putative Mediator of RNA polymerase II transcription subunit 18 [Cinnamomum micranthum f. kanehirae]|uniref:Putative Mediator of RNA polymerase II transcription subunit 18 n=1 Tax=Cinnamomum micranthum f. kanehirae TaxID=337451 RepID=A0A443PSZ2_9MAGN|nr:putative Mediator of RNA polymerase II transcription subunit 18 [Cinnamomum micranthum f. kanehirae]